MRLNSPGEGEKSHQRGRRPSTGATEGNKAIWQSEHPLRDVSWSYGVWCSSGSLGICCRPFSLGNTPALLVSWPPIPFLTCLHLSSQYSRMFLRFHLVSTAALEKPSSDPTSKQPRSVPCPWGIAGGGPQGTLPPLTESTKSHLVKEAPKKRSLHLLIPP